MLEERKRKRKRSFQRQVKWYDTRGLADVSGNIIAKSQIDYLFILAFHTLAGEGGKRLGSEVGSILKPTDADPR